MSEEILAAEPTLPAQTTAPATEPSGWMGSDGVFREGAPDNVRTLLETKKWENVEQMADAYAKLEKFTGVGKHLVIPEADDAEGWDNVYNTMGRPETHDKYGIEYEGDVPLSDELVGQFKQFAHGLGLTQKQFNEVVNFQLDAITAQAGEFETQSAAAKEEAKAANIAALTEAFGAEGYLTRVTDARTMADKLGIYQTLEDKGIASDVDIIKMLDKLSAADAEGALHPTPPPPSQKTPQDRMVEIKEDPAFTDKFHIDHKAIMVEFNAINKQIVDAGQGRAPRG